MSSIATDHTSYHPWLSQLVLSHILYHLDFATAEADLRYFMLTRSSPNKVPLLFFSLIHPLSFNPH